MKSNLKEGFYWFKDYSDAEWTIVQVANSKVFEDNPRVYFSGEQSSSPLWEMEGTFHGPLTHP